MEISEGELVQVGKHFNQSQSIPLDIDWNLYSLSWFALWGVNFDDKCCRSHFTRQIRAAINRYRGLDSQDHMDSLCSLNFEPSILNLKTVLDCQMINFMLNYHSLLEFSYWEQDWTKRMSLHSSSLLPFTSSHEMQTLVYPKLC